MTPPRATVAVSFYKVLKVLPPRFMTVVTKLVLMLTTAAWPDWQVLAFSFYIDS